MRNYKFILFLLIIAFIVIFAGSGCERKDIVVDPPGSDYYPWVEEYTAFPGPLFPHDSLLIVDSVVFPGKIASGLLHSNDNPIPMKTVLYFGWERLVFLIEIFRDDTILVNQYNGKLFKIGDTFRFNIGDTIIQDYGFEYLGNNSIRIYDFKWPDSNGLTFINIPHDYLLWWGFAPKTEGVFVRKEI